MDTAAYSLAMKVNEAQPAIKTLLSKVESCRERALEQIPDADSQYAEQIRDLVQNMNNIRESLAEVRDFLNTTPLTMSSSDFAAACEVMTEKCSRILGDAKAQLDQIIANIKGAEKISTAFSKDPVNLSTGNFIYDRTDLEIGGLHPFRFGRFYNAINHRKGALGKDWNHNYEVRILTEGEDVVLLREDGKEERFVKTSTGAYASIYHSTGSLSETEDGYLYETREQEKYRFDKTGRFLRQESADGTATDLHYDGQGRLARVERTTGESFDLSYDEEGYLASVSDHTKRTITYRMEDGYLAAVSTPGGHWLKYEYAKSGKLAGVTSPRGIRIVENEYDGRMRTTLQKFPDGGQMSYAYDDKKGEVVLTERNGSRITYVHDGQFRDIRHIYSDGEERFEYNKLNQKTLVVDKLGNRTQLAYGNQGDMQPFGYTGYQHDRIAGTYFAQAREYRTGEGRFGGVDLIKGNIVEPFTLNHYGYCWNNPEIYVDLDGCLSRQIRNTLLQPMLPQLGERVQKKFIEGLERAIANYDTERKETHGETLEEMQELHYSENLTDYTEAIDAWLYQQNRDLDTIGWFWGAGLLVIEFFKYMYFLPYWGDMKEDHEAIALGIKWYKEGFCDE